MSTERSIVEAAMAKEQNGSGFVGRGRGGRGRGARGATRGLGVTRGNFQCFYNVKISQII